VFESPYPLVEVLGYLFVVRDFAVRDWLGRTWMALTSAK
jgi:hypothetical protein